jgi:hypothetical protein
MCSFSTDPEPFNYSQGDIYWDSSIFKKEQIVSTSPGCSVDGLTSLSKLLSRGNGKNPTTVTSLFPLIINKPFDHSTYPYEPLAS